MGCGCSCQPKEERVTLRRPAGEMGRRAPEDVPVLSTRLGWRERLGGWAVRLGIRRMRYSVSPGLYRLGQPDGRSPVLVTANYKLTVDTVRRSLPGQSAWLLVLDTKGVNVWCAAGKGTLGTDEVVRGVERSGLSSLVEHRTLVLPQLSATGVAAHEVKRATGFLVRFGPVLARDIPDYLAAGMQATPAMRRVPFGWRERLVVAPMELVNARGVALAILAALAVLHLVQYRRMTAHYAADAAPFLAAIVAGGLLVPLLLPWLPFRALVLKGSVVGFVVAAASLLLLPMSILEATGTALLVTAIVAYMAMMFTGATTFTTYAGARLEVRRGLPPIIASVILGVILRVVAVFA